MCCSSLYYAADWEFQIGHVFENYYEPNFNHLLPNARGVRRSYRSNISGSSSYHSDIGGLSSYHPDIGDLSSFHLEQPSISFDMFGNNVYSTRPQATFGPTVDPPNVYSTPQRPPRQRRPVNCYTPNDDTTPGSFQF
ncbi:hypothetical protein J1N35_010014 [Gossypium stocksii]|uniref:Uncharacterized protein n=1 Tax=Gossypium stocksii TaxID=47602 RepID=A0A9D4ACC5_9ROSI|nr:hypothetical protein J1N35_010014 [Gossypium stocksii]